MTMAAGRKAAIREAKQLRKDGFKKNAGDYLDRAATFYRDGVKTKEDLTLSERKSLNKAFQKGLNEYSAT